MCASSVLSRFAGATVSYTKLHAEKVLAEASVVMSVDICQCFQSQINAKVETMADIEM